MASYSFLSLHYGCGLLTALCLAGCGDSVQEQESSCELDFTVQADVLDAAGEAVEKRRAELDAACRAIAVGLDADNAPPDDGSVDIKVSCGAAKTAIAEVVAMGTSIDIATYECVADAEAQLACEDGCDGFADCTAVCPLAGVEAAACDATASLVVTSDDDAVKAVLESQFPTVLEVFAHVGDIASVLAPLFEISTQEQDSCGDQYAAFIADAAEILEASEEVLAESGPVVGAASR